jgi:hypothetical protein
MKQHLLSQVIALSIKQKLSLAIILTNQLLQNQNGTKLDPLLKTMQLQNLKDVEFTTTMINAIINSILDFLGQWKRCSLTFQFTMELQRIRLKKMELLQLILLCKFLIQLAAMMAQQDAQNITQHLEIANTQVQRLELK